MQVRHIALVLTLVWLFCTSADSQSTETPFRSLPHAGQDSIFGALAQKLPDLSWNQLAKLKSTNAQSGDYFGSSVAISGDTAVVGIRNYGKNYVYVFVKPASGWGNMVQTAELTPSDGANGFGWAVAIDRDTIAVGGSGNYPYGEVYVYVKPTTGWKNMHEMARLTTTIEYGYLIGDQVAVSGNTVLTASYKDSPVLVYQRPRHGWKNTSTPNATLNSSSVVSFAIGGPTIVVGEGSDALIFLEPQGGWTGNLNPIAKLIPSDHPNYFAYSVAIDHEGDTVVAAARVCGLCYPGELYVFVRPTQGWVDATQIAQLKIRNNFGLATVAISEDGTNIVTGSPGATVGTNQLQGAAYVFTKPRSGWRTTKKFSAKLIATDGAPNDQLGTSVGVSGSTIVAGAPNATIGSNSYQGAAYVFGK
jgi:hypothetical protein